MRKTVRTPEDLKKLARADYHRLVAMEPPIGVCIVCEKSIKAIDDWAKHFPCEHLYHEECWAAWYWRHRECPCVERKREEEKNKEKSE
jgi:hypothetical protein